MDENGRQKKRDRNKNGGNTQGVASPVYGMMVTVGVLCDPLLVAAIAEHCASNHTPSETLFSPQNNSHDIGSTESNSRHPCSQRGSSLTEFPMRTAYLRSKYSTLGWVQGRRLRIYPAPFSGFPVMAW